MFEASYKPITNFLITRLSHEYIVKISDFGMLRDMYQNDYYRPKEGNPLPIKWMSLESLKTGKFTSETDVVSSRLLII